MVRNEIRTKDDYTNALHEVMQQTALAGLYRGGFFKRKKMYICNKRINIHILKVAPDTYKG
jgi:hypothetical protein